MLQLLWFPSKNLSHISLVHEYPVKTSLVSYVAIVPICVTAFNANVLLLIEIGKHDVIFGPYVLTRVFLWPICMKLVSESLLKAVNKSDIVRNGRRPIPLLNSRLKM